MHDAASALLRGCFLAALLAPVGLSARADDCVAWAGEPRPLPRIEDPDPQRARWAELRVQELARRAQDLEAGSPIAAHQAWRRVLCLAPADERALVGVLRTLPLRVHRPQVSVASDAEPALLDTDVWLALDAPLAVALVPSRPRAYGSRSNPGTEPALAAPGRTESLRRVERSLTTAEAQIDAARFDEALDTLDRARASIEGLPGGRDLHASQLRLELAQATAQAASGHSDEARACLARVLALEPGFRFDPSTTSPKLLRLLDAARADQGAAQ